MCVIHFSQYIDICGYIYFFIVFRRYVDSQSPMSPPSPSWEVSADDAPRWHWGRPGALRCGLELPAHGYMDTTITKTMYVVPCVCIYIYHIYGTWIPHLYTYQILP